MGRLIDVVLALLALVFLSPLFIFAIIGILLSDYGPLFYMASRAGVGGKEILVYKFRSMRINNASISRVTSANDSRIFPFGKLIRKLKIDELPQLLNILSGDMAVIGPRPEDLSIVNNHYSEYMKGSLNVRPGLASPGSIFNYTHLERLLDEGNAEKIYIRQVLPLKVAMDVVYTKRKSLAYDISLIFRTLHVIIAQVFGQKQFDLPTEYHIALLELTDQDIELTELRKEFEYLS